ncbi:MAG TPA: DUF2062 domain-containing protein [Patescibacteria group bacterium]|nr:DUF2062 domain-containing protein [Patescibacteria group bacterium]
MKKFLIKVRQEFLSLFTLNDSPHRIALGAGIGVFLGILPGTGPLAALCVALFVPVNRAALLAGVFLTNTWLTVATFFLSIKVGSAIMSLNWQDVANNWVVFLRDFRLADLLKISCLKIVLPLALGFLLVGLTAGFLVYVLILAAFWMRSMRPREKRERA